MIHVLATVRLVPGKREEFLSEFRRIVPQVRAEQGCIEYGPAVDLPTSLPAQPPARDDVVVVIEKWSDLDALQAHLMAPHVVSYRTRVKSLILNTELQILQPAE